MKKVIINLSMMIIVMVLTGCQSERITKMEDYLKENDYTCEENVTIDEFKDNERKDKSFVVCKKEDEESKKTFYMYYDEENSKPYYYIALDDANLTVNNQLTANQNNRPTIPLYKGNEDIYSNGQTLCFYYRKSSEPTITYEVDAYFSASDDTTCKKYLKTVNTTLRDFEGLFIGADLPIK